VDEDIYNFDETGFQIGVISTAKVITRAERSRRHVSVQPGNRKWVTAIDCIYTDRVCHQSLFLRANCTKTPGMIQRSSYL
jgi:hypothetical protein